MARPKFRKREGSRGAPAIGAPAVTVLGEPAERFLADVLRNEFLATDEISPPSYALKLYSHTPKEGKIPQ